MKTASTLVFTILAALPLVAAHGIVQDIKIDGKSFKGNGVNGGPVVASGIRQVTAQDPIKGAKNPDVNCGTNSKPASMVLNVNPGSKMEFDWRTASGTPWPHDTGPMMTYMASCGPTTCDKFDSTKAKWFKIDEVGKNDDGSWKQKDLMKGALSSTTIPSNIAPGNYMVRHEIIALHLATNKGGAEFYVGCVQTNIGGSGTGAPKPEDLVSLPGAYSDTDPGILVDAYNTKAKYTFPGPPVSNLGAAASNSTGSGSASGNKKGTSGSCRLKSNNANSATNHYRPRNLSRVMRSLLNH